MGVLFRAEPVAASYWPHSGLVDFPSVAVRVNTIWSPTRSYISVLLASHLLYYMPFLNQFLRHTLHGQQLTQRHQIHSPQSFSQRFPLVDPGTLGKSPNHLLALANSPPSMLELTPCQQTTAPLSIPKYTKPSPNNMNTSNTQRNMSGAPAYPASTASSGSTQRHASSGHYSLTRWLGESKTEQPWSQANSRGYQSQSGKQQINGVKK